MVHVQNCCFAFVDVLVIAIAVFVAQAPHMNAILFSRTILGYSENYLLTDKRDASGRENDRVWAQTDAVKFIVLPITLSSGL